MARPLPALFALVLLLAWGVGGPDAAAQTADEACLTAIDQAEDQYRNGDYNASVQLLSACLDRSGIADSIATSAYRLLALSHLRGDELESARLAVVNLLGIRPDFQPDPVADPPPFVSLVAVVREQIQTTVPADSLAPAIAQSPQGQDSERPTRPTPFFRRTSTWLALGGSLVVGGVVSLVAGGSGSSGGGGGPPTSPSDLPPPPAPPQ